MSFHPMNWSSPFFFLLFPTFISLTVTFLGLLCTRKKATTILCALCSMAAPFNSSPSPFFSSDGVLGVKEGKRTISDEQHQPASLFIEDFFGKVTDKHNEDGRYWLCAPRPAPLRWCIKPDELERRKSDGQFSSGEVLANTRRISHDSIMYLGEMKKQLSVVLEKCQPCWTINWSESVQHQSKHRPRPCNTGSNNSTPVIHQQGPLPHIHTLILANYVYTDVRTH